MTAVDDLVAWLTQVWDEEEKAAYRAAGGKEYPGPNWTLSEDVIGNPGGYVACGAYGGGIKEEIGEFIVAHDPASVLARIAADRKILAEHSSEFCQDSACGTEPCRFQRLLASPYRDRPGYQENWAVQ